MKLYILTKFSANDVKFILLDRQRPDFLKYIYLWYGKFFFSSDTAQFYKNKNGPRYLQYPALRSHVLTPSNDRSRSLFSL